MIARWIFSEVRFGGSVVEKAFTKFADGEAFQRLEVFSIEGIQNQAADVVLVRINQRILHDLVERQIGELAFRGNALAFRASGDSGQLIARLHLVGFGKKLTKIGKCESLRHNGASEKHVANFSGKLTSIRRQRKVVRLRRGIRECRGIAVFSHCCERGYR